MAVDLDKINDILDDISREDRLLGQAIDRYIQDFEYERILKLLPIK